jgi:23S rRNA pseudouridine1911/1915/1917 synthase
MSDSEGGRHGGWLEHVVDASQAGSTVEQILRGPMQISRRMIQRLTRAHGIALNRRATYLSRKVRTGDRVSARVAGGEKSDLEPVAMDLSVVYEDHDLLAVDKPPFLLVHPTAPHHQATLAHGVAHFLAARGLEARVRPVHRIDRDTSGLVLFAKSAHAHHLLDLQLRDSRFQREYVAVAEGSVEPDAGEFRDPIGSHPQFPHLRAVMESGSPAHTRYRVLGRTASATLLTLQLETGRTHQIRVHLSHAHHPVVGDRQYGAPDSGLLRRPALHSAGCSFQHPSSGRPLLLSAPLPPDLLELIRRLGLAVPAGATPGEVRD